MAIPIPTPTIEQVESVAEITMLSTDTVTSMISTYNQEVGNAKWTLTLDDIDNWVGVRDAVDDVKKLGAIEFFNSVSQATRLSFRNKLRTRYGQSALADELGLEAASIRTRSTSKKICFGW